MNPYQSPSDEASKPVEPRYEVACVRGYLRWVQVDADGKQIIPPKSWRERLDDFVTALMSFGW